MVLPIVIYGDPVLRERGKVVTEITEEIRALAENMLETMHEAHGVGLAAQQVGHALQLAVVELPEDDKSVTFVRVNGEEKKIADIMPLVFVNPKLELGKQKLVGEEGCLSFPDLRDDIRRSVSLKATLTLLNGETITLETDGLFSRAIQHEADHLNGILFIDRMSPLAKLSLKRRLRELAPEWEDRKKEMAAKK